MSSRTGHPEQPAAGLPPPALRAVAIEKSYGGLRVLTDVGFEVAAGETLGIIGPNGAGKSTLMGIIAGLVPAEGGRVLMDGEPLDGLPAHERVRRGLGLVLQRNVIFWGMTVAENVRAGAHTRETVGLIASALRSPRLRREERWLSDQVEALLAELGLTRLADADATDLPYGLQRLVAVARALATGCRIIILDEPAAGLHPEEKAHLLDWLRNVAVTRGLTMIVIEHDVDFLFQLVDRVLVLHDGRVLTVGTPDDVLEDARVIESYLGGGVSR